MFEKLHVENYRIFRDLEISQLRRINLIAGSNNSGKTTLLETVFLLVGGNAQMALNAHVARVDTEPGVRLVGDNVWKPFFSDLDMSKTIMIEGLHAAHGRMRLEILSDRPRTSEIIVDSSDGISATQRPDDHTLTFTYTPPRGQPVLSHVQAIGTTIRGEKSALGMPFRAEIVLSRVPNGQEDAIRLANLRKQKRENILLNALKVIEPKLLSVEENSASGAPLIWGDIGLSELIPLAVMGEGMSRIARLVLSISAVEDGIVLVDEVENGIHHTVLPKLWLAIDSAAEQFNTQVFATTHSMECVAAAHESLDSNAFRLHRLDVEDGTVRSVTYNPNTIEAAIHHNLEVR